MALGWSPRMMSVADSALQLCANLGVREFIVCAGARNLSLIETLLASEEVHVWNHFEENSAGFFALGRCMATAEPCCIVTTSGTAVAELLPAVIEAHYQARPLVILSADRPSHFRGSGAPQAIEQLGIFGDYVETCVDIEGSVPELTWSGRKPLHLNVCLEESSQQGETLLSPKEFKPSRQRIIVSELVKFIHDAWDGLVVALGGLEPEDREEVFHFLKDLKVPVIADATSGLREAMDKMLVAEPEDLFKKGMVGSVLRIGEVPVGRFWRDLEEKTEVKVCSVSRTGFSGLARASVVIEGDVTRILKGMGEPDEIGDVTDAMANNSRDWARVDEVLESYPDSEPAMIRMLSQYATIAGSLYLGNSLPIREWNQFAQREIPIEFVRANRGANGIDGQISTWLGNSAEVDDSWCVVGDLTALYDLAGLSLWKQAGGLRRTLVVVNNGGGRIFERLSSVQNMSEETKEAVVNEHELSFENLAKTWGIRYVCYTNVEKMEIEPPEEGILVELRPSDEQTKKFWEVYKAP